MDIKNCYAINDGFILVAGERADYGKRVYVRHNDGTTIMYAHLDSMSVKQGDKVKKGDEIGVIGDSGYSNGVHLHVSFFPTGCIDLNARHTVDPMDYFKEHDYPCLGKITNKFGSDICNPKLPYHEGVDFSAKTPRNKSKKKKVKDESV